MDEYKNTSDSHIDGETWLDIPQWEGLYQCSSFGRIKSYDRIVNTPGGKRTINGWVLSQCKDKKGYLRVILYKDLAPKNCQVHRLVGLTFIPNPENKPQINHLFGVKDDNRVSELGWATSSENELHSYRVLGKQPTMAGLGKKGSLHSRSKPIKCLTTGGIFESIREAADKLKISQGNISEVLLGRRRHASKHLFEFVKQN